MPDIKIEIPRNLLQDDNLGRNETKILRTLEKALRKCVQFDVSDSPVGKRLGICEGDVCVRTSQVRATHKTIFVDITMLKAPALTLEARHQIAETVNTCIGNSLVRCDLKAQKAVRVWIHVKDTKVDFVEKNLD